MIRWWGVSTIVLMVVLSLLGVQVPAAMAISIQAVCTGVGTPIQDAVNKACNGDSISVSSSGGMPCNESVTVDNVVDNNLPARCSAQVGMPFTKLTITGTSNASNNFTPGPGPAFLITGNAWNITISNFIVGAAAGDGIDVVSAHRVTLTNIRTANPGSFATGDGIRIDTASTRVRVLSSTLNGNGGDGLEMGATYGDVSSVTANDNGAVGINVTGSNVNVTRCKANETNSVGNIQQEGFRFSGPGAIVQQCAATDNAVAQFHDDGNSTGVIHFRNVAGTSSAAEPPSTGGKGFLEEGTGNRINTCTAIRNNGDGFDIEGNGNALQLSIANSNGTGPAPATHIGAQLAIGGNNNFIQSNTFTRVSAPNAFASTDPAVNCPAGLSNFFDRNRVSISTPTASPNGFNVPDPTNNGSSNTRAPSDAADPPLNLR